MLEKPNIYLYDQDFGQLSITGLQFGNTSFGRDTELSTIKDAYRRSTKLDGGENEMAIISGPSGSGKSLLANEFGTYVTASGGYFLSGKFDQLHQGKPFSALASAFDVFCGDLLKKQDNHVSLSIAKELASRLRGEEYHLAKIIPNLALILGPQQTDGHSQDLCVNRQKRLQYLLCQFVDVLSESFGGAPVTLFLDDLQWADSASIAAVNQLLLTTDFSSSQKRRKPFYFLGCCREGEINEKHPVWKLLRNAEILDVVITNVKLKFMDDKTLNTMVSEILCLSPRLTWPLSSIIHHKTKGNPLFVSQLMLSLNKEGLLWPSLSRRRWEWDEEKIRSQKLPDNVAMFFTSSIKELPEGVQSSLCLLSFFGAAADISFIKVLETVFDMRDLLKNLDLGAEEGYLVRGDQYRFSHDRIQEAAYNMIPEIEKPLVHVDYGIKLASTSIQEGNDDLLFVAANQVNLGGPKAVGDKSTSFTLATLNLRAGKKSIELSDYAAAYSYFDNGISFLRKKHWEEHYDLSLELFELAANCALTNGDFVSLKTLSEQVLTKSRCVEDSLNVMYFATCGLTYSWRLPEAISKSLAILSKLGITLEETTVEQCLQETKDMLLQRTDDEILNTKRMTDSTMITAMKFLGKLEVCLTQAKPAAVPFVTKKIIELSLSHGMCDVSPVGFVYLGAFLAGLGELSSGYHYVKLAHSLLDTVGSRESAGEVFAIGTQVRAYVEPLQAALEYHNEGYTAAMAAGDTSNAMLNKVLGLNGFYAGKKLEIVYQEMSNANKLLEEQGHLIFKMQIASGASSLYKLIGSDEEPKEIPEQSALVSSNNAVLRSFCFQKSFISFIFRSYDDTKTNATLYFSCHKSTWANLMTMHAVHAFYTGLISYWIARQSREGERQWHERGKNSKLALKQWAETSRWNFENKWLLLEAEEAFCNNNLEAASSFYDRAITSAKTHKVRRRVESASKFMFYSSSSLNFRLSLVHTVRQRRGFGL
ncbi:hypothetical protein ACHAWC_007538 [Mediolabrus comicus]